MREILSLPPQIIYIFAFLPSLLCHVQLVAVEEPEPAARGGERKEGRGGVLPGCLPVKDLDRRADKAEIA